MFWSHYRLPRPRQKGAHFLSDLVVAYASPPHTSGFTLQILDLTHIWSGSGADVIELNDIPAQAAAVYVHEIASFAAAEVSTHAPELLTAVAEAGT